MTRINQKRWAQIVCAALVHVPMIAIVIYALWDGFMSDLNILGVALLATLAATILIVIYVGHILGEKTRLSSRV